MLRASAFRQGERAVVQRVSGFIKWGGRYPIPTRADQMKPSSTGRRPHTRSKLSLRSRTQACQTLGAAPDDGG